MSRLISVGKNKSTTTKEALYTVPTKQTAYWNLLYIVNTGANNKYVTVYWYDKSANVEYYVLNQYTLNSRQYVQFDGNAVTVLEEGDEIRVETESSSSFSFIATLDLEPKIAAQHNY
jgi:hypothetical protein